MQKKWIVEWATNNSEDREFPSSLSPSQSCTIHPSIHQSLLSSAFREKEGGEEKATPSFFPLSSSLFFFRSAFFFVLSFSFRARHSLTVCDRLGNSTHLLSLQYHNARLRFQPLTSRTFLWATSIRAKPPRNSSRPALNAMVFSSLSLLSTLPSTLPLQPPHLLPTMFLLKTPQ